MRDCFIKKENNELKSKKRIVVYEKKSQQSRKRYANKKWRRIRINKKAELSMANS